MTALVPVKEVMEALVRVLLAAVKLVMFEEVEVSDFPVIIGPLTTAVVVSELKFNLSTIEYIDGTLVGDAAGVGEIDGK